ncbi:MAG: hypothetical protein ABII71_02595 [Candidatus Micrarchaeota archaeon]
MALRGKVFVLLMLLLGCSFAVTVVSPVKLEVGEGDILDLGTIGPGQTIQVQIEPKVDTGGIHGKGGYYDMAQATVLPEGWMSEPSKLYGRPLQVKITADQDAPEGDYSAKVTVIDEMDGEELGNITFTAWIHITWDVLDVEVTPAYSTVGPGQPSRFEITVWNKGSASDAFNISATGARSWEFTKAVFVPAKSSKTIFYDLVGYEEETYKSKISVVSLASDNIHEEQDVTLFIKADLLGDFKATNRGTAIFPIFEAVIYSLAGLLSNFY